MTNHSKLARLAFSYSFFAVCVMIAVPLRMDAWGDYGHRTVARIAVEYLTPKARERIVDLLRADAKTARAYYQTNCPSVLALQEKASLTDSEKARLLSDGLACIASWPDPPLKWERAYTSNWHFVDIPVTLDPVGGNKIYSYEVSRDCRMDPERGDCAVLALSRLRPVLANAKQADGDNREHANVRAEALKFIVHIIGDLHQPLHTVTDKKDINNHEDLGDIGGNNKKARWLGADLNPRWNDQWSLHAIWDEGIIDQIIKVENLGNNEEKYAAKNIQTLRSLTPEAIRTIQSGTLLEWIHESYKLAVDHAYGINEYYDKNYEWKNKQGQTRKGGYVLPQAYYEANHGIVDRQVQAAGVRLARYLNDTFI